MQLLPRLVNLYLLSAAVPRLTARCSPRCILKCFSSVSRKGACVGSTPPASQSSPRFSTFHCYELTSLIPAFDNDRVSLFSGKPCDGRAHSIETLDFGCFQPSVYQVGTCVVVRTVILNSRFARAKRKIPASAQRFTP